MPSSQSLILDDRHYQAAARKARSLGVTTEHYISQLIDIDVLAEQPFDEMLESVREGFADLDEQKLDALFADTSKRTQKRDNQ